MLSSSSTWAARLDRRGDRRRPLDHGGERRAARRDTVARQHAFQEETREAALTIQAKRHDGNLFSALRAREEELTAAFDKILKEREAAFVEAEASFERAMKDQQDAHAKTIGDLEAQLLAFERAGPPLPPREKTVCCAGGSPAT